MKNIKRYLAFALTLVMAITFALPAAFAAGTGSITITPPSEVEAGKTLTYNIYKVFDADGNGTNVSYKLIDGKTEPPAGFTVDDAGNVSHNGDELTDADIAAIKTYVAGQTPIVATSVAPNAAVAENLPNGYYYIETSTGTVVTIDTTNPNAEVEDKNIVPTVDKKITNASSYDEDGKKALAQVGTQVEFTATVTVGKGQSNYVFKDKMSAGLEYVENSLNVVDMAAENYTLSVVPGTGDDEGKTIITVTFKNDAIKGLAQNYEIPIKYKATVTSDALQDDPANNTATISYGTDPNNLYTSNPSEVEVYNAKFTVTKVDGNNSALAGAGFKIKNAAGKFYKIENNVVSWVDEAAATQLTTTANSNIVVFTGLANGTYTLVESTVPSGYNKAADSDFTVADHDYTAANLQQKATVTNNAGTEMPSTGGIGTTIFYIVGGVMVAGAAIFLLTKRRANAAE